MGNPLKKSSLDPKKDPVQNILLILHIVLLLFLVTLVKLGQLPKQIFKTAHHFLKFNFITLPHLNQLKLRSFKLLIPRSLKFKLAFSFILFIFALYSLLLIKLSSQLPSPRQLTLANPLTTQIFDRQGRLLYQIYEGKNRQLAKIDQLPPYLILATIAAEDKRFFLHPGLDPLSIIRSIKYNLASQGDAWQGGSTITQQLIKNTLLTPDQTLRRKIKEAILALWTERIYSKKEILQMYLSEAPYGGPAWGIEAASETYFGKSAANLNLAEAAFLAGLPASPTQFSPYGAHPEKSKERQKYVLKRMVEEGYISSKQAEEASGIQLSIKPPRQEIKAPHFVMFVRALLATKYGERTISQGGLKVLTTLDWDLQQMAEVSVNNQINQVVGLNIGNGAAMIMDVQTGQILAMVGSKDYFDPKGGNFNVTLALRQPGSSIKPITYAAAFQAGFNPGTIILDTPITFTTPQGKPYSPQNYDGSFHGPVTLRTALGSSYNVPAVKLLSLIGLPAMIQTAQEMGIITFTKPEDYGLSLTLGGGAVKMIDMMTVYATLARGGIKYQPTAILTVTDNFGNTLEDNRQPEGKRVITSEIAYLLNHILSDNKARTPAFGPNSQLKIDGHTVAVKTGTSDDKRDNWTFGYTPEVVVGTWVGNNDNSPMDKKLASGISGAAPIWHEIMVQLLATRSEIAFKRPTGITEIIINGRKELGILGQQVKNMANLPQSKPQDTSLDLFSAPAEAQTKPN